MIPAVAIPNNIRVVLVEKGLNPHALAKMWKKHPNHVYSLLSKDTLSDDTRLKTMVELAELLGVSVDRLITKDGE